MSWLKKIFGSQSSQEMKVIRKKVPKLLKMRKIQKLQNQIFKK